jgi:hypothetical protein
MVKYQIVPPAAVKETIGSKKPGLQQICESDALPNVGDLITAGRGCCAYRVKEIVHLGNFDLQAMENSREVSFSHYVVLGDPISEEERLNYFYK